MFKIAHHIIKSSIFKDLSVLVSGTVIAQLMVIAFQVVLRRVYSPEDFGAFAVFMSVVGILATVSSLRYEQAIILPKEDHYGITLLWISWFTAIFFSIVVTIPFGIFNQSLAQFLNLPANYAWWLWFIPVSLLIFSLNQAFNYYLIRQKRFKLSAVNKILRRGVEGCSQSGFGFLSGGFGLFVGDSLGQLVVFINTLFKKGNGVLSFPQSSQIKGQLHNYKSFPLKNGLPSLMNAISLLLPVIIINQKFNQQITGYFDLARMVLILPLSLITASLSQILLQRFAERKNARLSIKKESLSTLLTLLLVAIVFGIVIFFGGELIFGFVFGEDWCDSGSYASILVWAFALKFVVSPFNIVFTAFEKIGILSIWQVIYFIFILFLYWFPTNDIHQFLKLYLIIELVSYTIAAIFDLYLIVQYELKLKR